MRLMGDRSVTGCRAWLVAGIAVVVVAGCGPTGAPDVVSGDAGPVTGSTPGSWPNDRCEGARRRTPPAVPRPGCPARPPVARAGRTGSRHAGGHRPVHGNGVPSRRHGRHASRAARRRQAGSPQERGRHVAHASGWHDARRGRHVARGRGVHASGGDGRAHLGHQRHRRLRRALPDADVIHRPSAEGTEDYVAFDSAPAREELVYDVDVSRAAGLRLVANTLEFLDKEGAPRLRVAPPMVIDAAGKSNAATLTVEGWHSTRIRRRLGDGRSRLRSRRGAGCAWRGAPSRIR